MSDAHDQNADDSQRGVANVKVHVIGQDSRLLTAVALAISIMAAFYSFEAGRETAQAVYWLQRSEAFLEQLSAQGVKVPPDLLQHREK